MVVKSTCLSSLSQSNEVYRDNLVQHWPHHFRRILLTPTTTTIISIIIRSKWTFQWWQSHLSIQTWKKKQILFNVDISEETVWTPISNACGKQFHQLGVKIANDLIVHCRFAIKGKRQKTNSTGQLLHLYHCSILFSPSNCTIGPKKEQFVFNTPSS